MAKLFGKKKKNSQQKSSIPAEQLMEQIVQWSSDGEHQQIIDTLRELPADKMDYELSGQLVCALNNIGDFDGAMEILSVMEPDGTEDYRWHYWKGYAFCNAGRFKEAVQLLERAQTLAPELGFITDLIEYCHAQQRRQKLDAIPETEIDPDDRECVVKNLQQLLSDLSTEIQDETLYIPEWNVEIQAWIGQSHDRSATLYYQIHSPEWDQPLLECSAGIGSSFHQAFGMAQGGFVFGMLNGIAELMTGTAFDHAQSSYAGKPHSWEVYQSDLIGMGDTPKGAEQTQFWNLLKEDILMRIGNQKLCYVKVYAAKNGDQITGECRINDVAIAALGKKVADYIQTWDSENFASQKQFFFLKQSAESYIPYPYTEQQLHDYTVKAAKLFYECEQRDDFDDLSEKLEKMTGDSTLATELHLFLPEICAENAFEKLSFPETLLFVLPGEESQSVFKTQIKSFSAIRNALFFAFDHDEFDGHTNDIYRICTLYSATAKVLQQVMEKEANLEEISLNLSICFRVDAEYEFR